jgi:hypothetical protein
VRQGIATNTKGTAFVVYEDVMDAKQACDKLNGFNFQNRYLVGMLLWFLAFLNLGRGRSTDIKSLSIISPAREDGQVKRGLGGSQGKLRTPQEATRDRLTIRRAY